MSKDRHDEVNSLYITAKRVFSMVEHLDEVGQETVMQMVNVMRMYQMTRDAEDVLDAEMASEDEFSEDMLTLS